MSKRSTSTYIFCEGIYNKITSNQRTISLQYKKKKKKRTFVLFGFTLFFLSCIKMELYSVGRIAWRQEITFVQAYFTGHAALLAHIHTKDVTFEAGYQLRRSLTSLSLTTRQLRALLPKVFVSFSLECNAKQCMQTINHLKHYSYCPLSKKNYCVIQTSFY